LSGDTGHDLRLSLCKYYRPSTEKFESSRLTAFG
jgi:hypothetical protein